MAESLIDKVREFENCESARDFFCDKYKESWTPECDVEFCLDLIIKQMTQALIAVDDVLKEQEQFKALRVGNPSQYVLFDLLVGKIRKAIESTNQE